ncbi:hypothetical protein [Staphylococcus virus vB_SurM-PSU5]|nr:hypothetical protein [Staphylococcus virus vB_SurM-PSU5]
MVIPSIKAQDKFKNELEYYKQGHVDKSKMLELAFDYIEELERNNEYITDLLEEERYGE